MCGIGGFLRFPSSDGTAWDNLDFGIALDLLKHRGPDDFGWLCFSNGETRTGRERCHGAGADAVLLHRRLSILDLSEGGWQPMRSADGRFAIVFNGEIYNYLELRKELEVLGHQFRSKSDTEVLLSAYIAWGADALKKLTGMFAFAILDTRERRLTLARDFFGIKPLYYAFWKGGFAFASEMKPLLRLPGINPDAHPQRVYDFLRFGLTDHGADTMIQSIKQLPASHYLEIPLNGPARDCPVRYWHIDLNRKREISFETAAEMVREQFLSNIRLHLRSDVPVGAALSGGIDSSAIVMAMRHLEGSNVDLHAFSYTAEDDAINEERWVDLVGQASGARIHKIRASAADLMADLDTLIDAQCEPFGSTSIYAQHRVFRLAKEKGIKVMLDGQGADELLGGYRGFLATRVASLLRQGHPVEAIQFARHAARLPGGEGLRLFLRAAGVLLPENLKGTARRLARRKLVPSWLNGDWFRERGVDLRAPYIAAGPDILRQQLLQSVQWTSLPMLLRYEDRNSMAHSIESRVPFLTPSLADLILSLPESCIIDSEGTTKAVFRRAMRGIVPDAILDRKDKIGFQTPELSWLETLRPWFESVISSDAARGGMPLVPEVIAEEWRNVLQRRHGFDFRFWRWANLIRWTGMLNIRYN